MHRRPTCAPVEVAPPTAAMSQPTVNKPKVIAFVPCKGSSSRIIGKNVKLLDSKPLFLHTLEKLIFHCPCVDLVVLDTESDDVIALAECLNKHNHRFAVMKRAPELATNATDGNKLFLNEVEQFHADIYVQILCTSPFISPDSISRSIEILQEKHAEFDSVVAVEVMKQYVWTESGPAYDRQQIPNSVDLPDTIVETMGMYVITREAALSTKRRFGNKPYPMQLTPVEAIDINYDSDFNLAERVARGNRLEVLRKLECVRMQLTSAILTDTMDDLNLTNHTALGLAPQGVKCKILGRAQTLKLRPLEEGEDFKGIYDALRSYDYIGTGDIIAVENPLNGRAYFGELNAHLAKKRGAAGVVTNGCTRDTDEVKQTGLPVFAVGSVCSDVRGRATVESINCSITLDGASCHPGDLIFADSEGVVVIPQEHENAVLTAALERILNETAIRSGILRDMSTDDIIAVHGNF